MILKRSFVIGLASFLNQASLSIDRVPSDDLSSLVEFYEKTSKHNPRDILRQLDPIRRYEQKSQNLTAILGFLFRQDIRVTDSELFFIVKALKRLENLLADRTQWMQQSIVDIRLEVAYAGGLLEDKIHPGFQRELINTVFHLNHADHLKLKSVEAIAGQAWLDKTLA